MAKRASEQVAKVKAEFSGKEVLTIASKAMRDPKALTEKQVQALAASVLTQAPDKFETKSTEIFEVPSTPDKHESVKAVKGQEPRS